VPSAAKSIWTRIASLFALGASDDSFVHEISRGAANSHANAYTDIIFWCAWISNGVLFFYQRIDVGRCHQQAHGSSFSGVAHSELVEVARDVVIYPAPQETGRSMTPGSLSRAGYFGRHSC
jgi:hypothetical protein